jgi:hypothetical protein
MSLGGNGVRINVGMYRLAINVEARLARNPRAESSLACAAGGVVVSRFHSVQSERNSKAQFLALQSCAPFRFASPAFLFRILKVTTQANRAQARATYKRSG